MTVRDSAAYLAPRGLSPRTGDWQPESGASPESRTLQR